MADNKKLGKDRLMERMRNKHPETNYEDDESFYSGIESDMDEYENKIGQYDHEREELSNMFASDPRSAKFLASWRNGADPFVEIINRFGPELKDYLEDPKNAEIIAEKNKEYQQRVLESQKYEEEYKANLKQTLDDMEQIMGSEGMSEDDMDEVFDFLNNIVKDGILGKFTPETIHMAIKAINHDTDVQAANHEGEVRGRNSRITEDLRSRKKSDGIPNLGGSSQSPKQAPLRTRTIFDDAKEA